MNRASLVIWLTLLIAQIFTYWLIRHWEGFIRDEDPVTQPLLSLASLTNAEWLSLQDTDTTRSPDADTEETETGLFKREALLLKLQDVQRALCRKGAQVQLVEDLQAWLSMQESWESGNGAAAFGTPYIEKVILWMEHMDALADHCGVERIMLHPDSGSAYPSLAFEISGSAGLVGQGLFALEQASPAWVLQEIDLHHPDTEADWWMRGSYCLAMEDLP